MHLLALGNSGRVCFLRQNIYISPGYVPRTRETYLATLPLKFKICVWEFQTRWIHLILSNRNP